MTALHRRSGFASAATLAGIVTTLGLAHAVAPGWAHAAGLDVWNTAAEHADLTATLARGDHLDTLVVHTQEQIRGSEGVVARLAAGRVSLATAADELLALNAGRSGWEAGLQYAYINAPTPRHRAARYALDKLARDHAADAARAARLDAEYRALPAE